MTGRPPPGRPEPDTGVDPGGEVGTAPDEEDEVDEASEESFPASDAPASWSGPSDD